jgi:RNA polymerase sigma factor (sigma-70 family)
VTRQGRQATPPELALPLSGAQAADQEIALYYARHRDRVRDFLVNGCECPEADAEDIVQDTIMTIRRRYWPRVRTLDKPEAYWFKIAARRYRRTRGRQAGRTADLDPSDELLEPAIPGDPFAQADCRQALEPVIRQLPPRQRQVLWLRVLADFSEADTAMILGISAGSVKTHLNHAKAQMRKLLRMDSATWEAEIR